MLVENQRCFSEGMVKLVACVDGLSLIIERVEMAGDTYSTKRNGQEKYAYKCQQFDIFTKSCRRPRLYDSASIE